VNAYPIQPYAQLPYVDPAFLLNGGNVRRETIPQGRYGARSDLTALTTQVMLSVAIVLQKDDLITSLTFRSGGTAANTPTNWWFALYSSAATPALLGQTADQTSTAWAADEEKTVALATPKRISEAGVYYVSIMMKATTPVSLAGIALDHAELSTGIVTGQKLLACTSGSSLTDTAPATIATPTAVVNIPYAVAS